jgi:3alpha(or 20beta)-hydroxysteroid dehydrogenase
MADNLININSKTIRVAQYFGYLFCNVRVNPIHPSPVNTRMMRSLEEGLNVEQETLAQSIRLGRYGESSDITNLVLFLASDESAFITGVHYRVDGSMGAL